VTAWPAAVLVREVGPRDGLQDEQPLPVADRVALIEACVATGVRAIEAVAFVSPTKVPAMDGAEAVMAGLDRRVDVVYSALVPNRRGAERAVAAGMDEVEVVVSASETHNQRNLACSVADSLVGAHGIADLARTAGVAVSAVVGTAFGCPFEGEVAPERVGQLAGHLVDAGAGVITFGDTTGMATPRRVHDLLDALERVGMGPDRIGLHFHDSRGLAMANVVTALDRGITRFDSGVGGLGGCPTAPGSAGNVATEDLVHMLDDMGIATGIDLGATIDAARLASRLVGHDLPGAVLRAGPRTRQEAQ